MEHYPVEKEISYRVEKEISCGVLSSQQKFTEELPVHHTPTTILPAEGVRVPQLPAVGVRVPHSLL